MGIRPRYEHYDLAADPWEQKNLAETPECAGVRDELHTRLISWMRETGDALLEGPVRSIYCDEILKRCGAGSPS